MYTKISDALKRFRNRDHGRIVYERYEEDCVFDEYLLDFCDEIDGRHYYYSDSDLSFLLSLVPSLNGYWQIFKGERIEGIFYCQRLIARSADV